MRTTDHTGNPRPHSNALAALVAMGPPSARPTELPLPVESGAGRHFTWPPAASSRLEIAST